MGIEFDDALEVVGGLGYIQKVHLLPLLVIQLFHAPFVMTLVFVGREPAMFECKDRPSLNPCQLDPPCQEFVYAKQFTSIVSEWDLVCEKKRDSGNTQSLVMFGFLAGVLVLGRTSDKYGRLKTFFWGTLTMVIAQLGSGFSTSLYQYAVSRFVVGFFYGGGGLAGHILFVEALLPKTRALISTVFHCAFALGIAVFGLMAYSARDWRHLTFLTCVPMIFLLIVPCVVPESARWLAMIGQIDRAESILMHMGKKNGLKVTRAMVTLVDKREDDKGKTSEGMMDLFRTPVMRMRMITLMFTWFTACMAYYGLTFGASNLGGNIYLNFALSGLVEIPACVFSIYTLDRFGRRPTMAGSMLIASFACIGVVVVPKSPETTLFSAQTCLALIGKMGVCVAFTTAYLFSNELLPTVLRTTAMGVCSMSARVGGMIAPTLPPFGETISYLAFGITALVSACLDLRLPESLNRHLPETIADVEKKTLKVSTKADGVNSIS